MKIKINIPLEIDLDNFYGSDVWKYLEAETIIDDVEDYAYDSLIDLMRNDKLKFWADYKLDGDIDESNI